MVGDQELVRQLQQCIRNWQPDGYCKVHGKDPAPFKNVGYDHQQCLTDLHLCGLGLVQLPSEVWRFSSLRALWLDSNQLSRLPAEAGQLSSLRTLDLSNNQLSALPAEVGQLSSLRTLDLSNNQLSALPAEVGQLTSLQNLYLSNNQLSWLAVEVGQLSSLRTLWLDDNPLGFPPPAIMAQDTLAILAYLRSLPSDIDRDRGLVEQLKRRFVRLPSHYWKEQYDVQGRLQVLSLYKMEIEQLPPELWQFTSLHELDLRVNQLSSLPAELGQLTSLHKLDLRKNQLGSLPVELGQLTNLHELNLAGNSLSSLPAELGQLTSLHELDLRVNQLSSLPAELGQLTSLHKLDLSGNPLSNLPAELGQLTNLYELNLSHSQFSSLPAELGQLVNLRTLSLYYTQLSSLPAELGQLVNLRQLSLHHTQLSSLPAELGQLANLQNLVLYENPQLQIPPPEVVEQGTTAVLAYLRALLQAKKMLPLKIFYCYAHEDRALRDDIDKHLSGLKRRGHVVVWYDREILAGMEWEREIERRLNTAHIILLLVSADFMSSDYCYGVEMQRALEMHDKGEVRVLPILLRPVDWRDTPFAKLQILPTGALPITRWSDRDEALTDVATRIGAVVTTLLTPQS